MLLEDEELEEEIVGYINDNLSTADVAASKVIDQQVAVLSEIDDEYLKSVQAICVIFNRLLRNILGMHIVVRRYQERSNSCCLRFNAI